MGEAHLLKCHNCDQIFRIKQDLMQHRKSKYFDKIRVCKYFNDGNCSFNTSCWYKHTTEVETTTNADQQVFKCNSCGSTFQGRGELMMHRKKIHYKTISKCKSFENGSCSRQNDNCWFSHEKVCKDDNNDLDF